MRSIRMKFDMQVHKRAVPSPGTYEKELSKLQPLRSEARDLNSLPPQSENSAARDVLDSNSLAGANPVYELADYFDELARKLSIK
jgi:hypothetical protein